MYDPDLYDFDEDGNPEYHGHAEKLEPDCMACYGSGSVRAVGVARVVLRKSWTRCPSCDPGRLTHWMFVTRWRVRSLVARTPLLGRLVVAVSRWGRVRFTAWSPSISDEPPF